MRTNILFGIGVLIIVFLNAFGFSEKNGHDKNSFNIYTANETLSAIQKKFITKSDYGDVERYVQRLDPLSDNAKKCVIDSESRLKTINGLFKSTQVDHVTQLQMADFKYLQQKQLSYAKQLSECQLFVYRSHEVLREYKDRLQQASTNQILKRSTPIWEIQDMHFLKSIADIDLNKVIAISGLSFIPFDQWIVCFIFIFILMIVSFYVRIFLRRAAENINNTHLLWCAFLNVLSQFIVPCAVLGLATAFLNFMYQSIYPTPTLELICRAALIVFLCTAFVKYLFYPAKSLPGLFLIPEPYGCLFYRRLVILFVMVFVGYVVTMAVREQALAAPLVDLSRTLFLTILCIITVWIFSLWHQSPHANQLQRGTLVFFSTVFIVALSALVLTEWLGYHRLAIFVIVDLCLTAIFTVIAMSIFRLIDLLYQWLDDNQYFVSRKVHQVFGVKFNKKIHEFFIVKLAAYFVVLCLYMVCILKSWSISTAFVDSVIDGLIEGFKFAGLKIIPLRIVLALISFSVILLAGRFLAATIAKKHRFRGEEDTQIAISTITIYISFSIAFLFGLMVTGIDFTGLAIIAGALSVGVGLGLQNIVNNFVSGLILLIEKPIKPGDRIVIGKTEGFVRKIRIRSTQIATLSKEDVIVPNADFITQQVTNYMFRDRHSRISCQVGVAYGSDVVLVKKLLLEIARNHNDVIHDVPNEPYVLFSRFAESSLIFDLWCVIHDVNKKYVVVSDLNFSIDAAFRSHNINIAYPQCDIHIKEYAASQPTRETHE
ncbi:MAG: mechanosensitive ion channel [Gammaproteobacteria bacterium]|nr:mechanosensitive ion channel [Gammaproteobacteria bacterium]